MYKMAHTHLHYTPSLSPHARTQSVINNAFNDNDSYRHIFLFDPFATHNRKANNVLLHYSGAQSTDWQTLRTWQQF